MPGLRKHVRFASFSTHYPSTPSASHSIPSLPSSSGPYTPPSAVAGLPRSYSLSHSSSRPKPKRSQSFSAPASTRVHHLLAYSHHPVINYDVSLPTSTITTSYKHLSASSFSEPAISPPVSSLVIQIPHHSWPISVHASFNGQYVTVNDVFTAIYHSLRKNISSSEYHGIPSKKDAEKVRMAYEMRYRRLRDRHAYEAEKKQGVKRVDFLCGHTHFMGLASAGRGSGVWVLNLS